MTLREVLGEFVDEICIADIIIDYKDQMEYKDMYKKVIKDIDDNINHSVNKYGSGILETELKLKHKQVSYICYDNMCHINIHHERHIVNLEIKKEIYFDNEWHRTKRIAICEDYKHPSRRHYPFMTLFYNSVNERYGRRGRSLFN